MRRFWTILIVSALAVTAFADAVKWQTDYNAALALAKKEKKIVMVDVYTDWCGWCKRLDKDVYANPDIQTKLSKSFVSVKVNPEKSRQGMELARNFGTRGYPHIVFLDGEGKKIGEIGGYLPVDQFGKQLDAIASKSK